ncbi:MAG: PAS domain S-box protein [Deltaproteobacteria bacterium]
MKESSRTKIELLEEISVLKKKIKKLEKSQFHYNITKNDSLESEQKYRTIFDSAPLGIFRSTPAGKFIEVNHALAKMLGYDSPEAVIKKISNIAKQIYVRSEDRQPIVDKQLQLSGITQHHNHYRRADGTEFFANLYLKTIKDEAGRPLYLEGIVEDITERKQTEEALKRSQKLLAETERVGKVGGWEFNIDNGKQTWTDEIYNIHEVDLTYNPTIEDGIKFYTPNSIPIIEQAVKQTIENNEPFDLELEIITAKGNLRHVHVIGNPDLDHHRVYGFFQDITERKQADEESRKNLQLLQMVIDHSQYLIYAKDLDERFILASLSLANFFGQRSPELLIGKTSHDFLPKEIADQHRTNDLEVIDQQSLVSCEETANTKDGLHTFLTNKFPLVDGKGKIYAVCGTSVDITERKQIEDELNKLNSYNRSLIEVSLDPLVTIDSSGRIADVNISTEQATGYSRQELIGTDFSDFFTDTEKAREGYQTVFKEGTVRDYPLEIRHRDGHTTAVLYNATVYRDKTNNIMGVFAAARDITKLKQAEAEKTALEAQNRQLQKSESLSRMAGAIAHHFNNQLGAVIGNLEMAMDELPKGASTHQTLTKAMQSAWKAADMSGLMLTYLGQTHDKREPVDISYSCRKILPLIKTTFPGNVVLETDFPLPRPIIMANAGEIQQLLTNLITNAREAIGNDKGTISLSVKAVSLIDIPTNNRFPVDWESLDKTFACLEVTDTGCGIEDKAIEQLFDPFYSTKFTGRGMGLAVVLGLVNSLKGVITVDSKQGSSSTFRLFFPVSEDALLQPQATESDRDVTISKPSAGKMKESGTVLVVEDEEILRDMAAAMLESFGFTVLKAKDGIEALEIFAKHQSEIKLVLTDLTMPRMDGWETLTALRKLQPDITVVLASGYDKAHVMEGDHPELPQAFLAKPYNLKALRNAIS